MKSPTRILVVDDDKRLVKAIQRVLTKAGYEVLTAFDGLTALRTARAEKPDLIILDIMMPGMDGYEVCHTLSRLSSTSQIPVLMLSSKGRLNVIKRRLQARVEDQVKGYDHGAMDFMTKPVSEQQLVRRVKGLLWLAR